MLQEENKTEKEDKNMLIVQIFGFAAIGSSLLIYTRKKRWSILGFKLVQDLCWAIHYLLLGAYSAMATNLICTTRELVFQSKNPRISSNKLILACFLAFLRSIGACYMEKCIQYFSRNEFRVFYNSFLYSKAPVHETDGPSVSAMYVGV